MRLSLLTRLGQVSLLWSVVYRLFSSIFIDCQASGLPAGPESLEPYIICTAHALLLGPWHKLYTASMDWCGSSQRDSNVWINTQKLSSQHNSNTSSLISTELNSSSWLLVILLISLNTDYIMQPRSLGIAARIRSYVCIAGLLAGCSYLNNGSWPAGCHSGFIGSVAPGSSHHVISTKQSIWA